MTITIIVPCYNEDDVLKTSDSELRSILLQMKNSNLVSDNSFILYVDDGSNDKTWDIIKSLALKYKEVKGIKLSHNRGHQNALLAGLEYCVNKCDASITIDADLQDDIKLIPEMVNHYKSGADVICGVRDNRNSDSWFKRNSAHFFYKIMQFLGVNCIYNHADFRLLSNRAMRDLLAYGERNIFLRGIIPELGYNQQQIKYTRTPRKQGYTKYPFKKMVEFAIDGITSFSVKPVRMLFWIGCLFIFLAIAIGIYSLIRYSSGDTVVGWTSLILSIWFCTGIILVCMGILGEYIGKIYIEVKHRPRYFIEQEV